MSRPVAVLVGLTGLVGFLIGLVVAGTSPRSGARPIEARHQTTAPLALVPAAPVPPATPKGPGIDFASVAANVNRAVVNVDTAWRGSDQPRRSRQYSTDGAGAPREGSGSGFVIDPAGFILTNQHVVAGADRVTVTLADGRALRAAVVGTDATLDVALLKVDTDAPLPAASLGDSSALRVGEWVCAIGNPLGVYVHSVTVGVVSYLGRKLFDQSLDAYIQTDAAISVGNSGGPLINAHGDVVGITTAVSAQAASIGFAIPISEVVAILPQLKTEGRVARGELGASLRALTAGLRRALGIEPQAGALIEDVQDDGPAARAGLRAYDVVTSVDGLSVRSDDELVRRVAAAEPGRVARLGVWRDGASISVPVRLGVRPIAVAARRLAEAEDARPAARDQAPLGFGVRDLAPDLIERLGLPVNMQGILVTEVDPAGPARLAELRTNHVITEIGRERVRSVADFRRQVASIRVGQPVALLVYDRATRQHRLCIVVPEDIQ
jgi:serine protease Do